MAKFEAESYSRFRILYPEVVFEGLKSVCAATGGERLRVLDLGAGTGFSSLSFLRFFPETDLVLVEPDASMLEASREVLADHGGHCEWIHSRAENFTVSKPVDIILVGSAWHWMNPEQTLQSILSSLRPGGAILVFEYQFPKAKEETALNEWVRRSFNLKWKPGTQKPRGTLVEITQTIRDHAGLSEVSRRELTKQEVLSAEDFFGVIVSQSRFLDYERTLNSSEKNENRAELLRELGDFWKEKQGISFEYSFQSIVFFRRWV